MDVNGCVTLILIVNIAFTKKITEWMAKVEWSFCTCRVPPLDAIGLQFLFSFLFSYFSEGEFWERSVCMRISLPWAYFPEMLVNIDQMSFSRLPFRIDKKFVHCRHLSMQSRFCDWSLAIHFVNLRFWMLSQPTENWWARFWLNEFGMQCSLEEWKGFFISPNIIHGIPVSHAPLVSWFHPI